MKIERNREIKILKMSQSIFIDKILEIHNMREYHTSPVFMKLNVNNILISAQPDYETDLNDVIIYKNELREINYLSIQTRSNIIFITCKLIIFAFNSNYSH